MALEDHAEQLLDLLAGQQEPKVAKVVIASGVAVQNTGKTAQTYYVPVIGKGKAVFAMGPAESAANVLGTVESAAGDEVIESVSVPPGWWLKVTLTEATLGEATIVSC